jgi:hypothetical protein
LPLEENKGGPSEIRITKIEPKIAEGSFGLESFQIFQSKALWNSTGTGLSAVFFIWHKFGKLWKGDDL